MKQSSNFTIALISLFAASTLTLQSCASTTIDTKKPMQTATHQTPSQPYTPNVPTTHTKPRTTEVVTVKNSKQLMEVLHKSAYLIAIDEDGNETLLTSHKETPPEACTKEPTKKSQKKCAAFNNKLYLTDLKTRTMMIMHGSPKIMTYQGAHGELYQLCKERRSAHNHKETGTLGHTKTIQCPDPIH